MAFGERHQFDAHAVAHHGHTVEHDPSRGITVQIGHEATVFASSPIPVVGDFRSSSVARGGQGAPLVPLADRDLFADFAESGIFLFDPTSRQTTFVDLPISKIVGFGEDANGEIFLLSLTSGVFALLPAH
jgi:1,6-anhydro-N-acetylmuramate kinase